jgi:putative hemolysin
VADSIRPDIFECLVCDLRDRLGIRPKIPTGKLIRERRSTRRALALVYQPEKFLSAAQIGITLIAILTGVYSGETFAHDLQPWLERWALLRPYAETLSTILVVVGVTFLSIILGELFPKQIGLMRAERIALVVAGPMNTFARITAPLVWTLNQTTTLIFRLFNIRRSQEDAVTEEEIKTLITEGTEAGTIDEAEQEIIERVFHLSDRNITSLMTHRSDIVWFNLDDTEEQIKEKIVGEPHSAYPICEGDIDQIKGVVSIKDLYVHPCNRPYSFPKTTAPTRFWRNSKPPRFTLPSL